MWYHIQTALGPLRVFCTDCLRYFLVWTPRSLLLKWRCWVGVQTRCSTCRHLNDARHLRGLVQTICENHNIILKSSPLHNVTVTQNKNTMRGKKFLKKTSFQVRDGPIKRTATKQGWETQKHHVLRNDRSLPSGLQRNALASLVHFAHNNVK